MTLLHRWLCGAMAAGVIGLVAAPAGAAWEQEEQSCNLQPCLPSQPKPPTVYAGQFATGWQQVYCVRAPCPKGGRAVFLPARLPIRVDSIAFAPGTPRHLQLSPDAGDAKRRFAVFEGSVTIAFDRSIAVIRPFSAVHDRNSGGTKLSPVAPRR